MTRPGRSLLDGHSARRGYTVRAGSPVVGFRANLPRAMSGIAPSAARAATLGAARARALARDGGGDASARFFPTRRPRLSGV